MKKKKNYFRTHLHAQFSQSLKTAYLWTWVPAGSPGTLHNSPRTTQLRRPEQCTIQTRIIIMSNEYDSYICGEHVTILVTVMIVSYMPLI